MDLSGACLAVVLPDPAATYRYSAGSFPLEYVGTLFKMLIGSLVTKSFILLIEKFSANVPRSPVRELLEMEPETAKFR